MLVPLHDLVAAARQGGYALGAFNTYNLEITSAIIQAAEALRSPVILQTGAGALQGSAASALPALALALAREASVPVVLHLDHCSSPALMEQVLNLGYTSLMVDGSALPLAENIALTRQVVALGHRVGVTVEAELTGIVGDEDTAVQVTASSSTFTDPEIAAHFVTETGVDLLAVAIGNVHGFYKGEPRLDFALLERLSQRLSLPLVLHGASGLPDSAIQRAIQLGIAKINFNTELRAAYFAALSQHLASAHSGHDIPALMRQITAAVQAVVEEKLRLLGSAHGEE